jgi:hypothetical protein
MGRGWIVRVYVIITMFFLLISAMVMPAITDTRAQSEQYAQGIVKGFLDGYSQGYDDGRIGDPALDLASLADSARTMSEWYSDGYVDGYMGGYQQGYADAAAGKDRL